MSCGKGGLSKWLTRKHCCDGEDLVGAVVRARSDEHLGQLRVQREFRHDRAQVGEVSVVVQCCEIVQQLQGTHERLGRWRVHEIEVDQVVDAELLQLQNDRP